MSAPQPSRTFRRWAIEITGSPLDGSRRHYRGLPELGMPILFRTREEARAWLKEFRARSGWAIRRRWAVEGGARIYRSVRAVPILVTIDPREP